MKTMMFIAALLFTGQALSVVDLFPGTTADLTGKLGLQMEREQGAWFRYGTNIWLGATERKACKRLNKMKDPNSKGVEFENLQSGLTEENDWTEHQAQAEFFPLHTVSCYIPDAEPLDSSDDRFAPERCWYPDNSSRPIPDHLLTPSDFNQMAEATYGSQSDYPYPAHYVPSPTDAGTYVIKAQFHGDTGEFIWGDCAPAIFDIVREEDNAYRSGQTISGYYSHKYCPPGTRLLYEYGHPDGQWGGYYCGNGRTYTGTMEYKQIPELLYDNCKHTATIGGKIRLKAPWKPRCDGADCPTDKMYLYVDYEGDVPGEEGLPDGWADAQIEVAGKYNQNLGKMIYKAVISRESFGIGSGAVDGTEPQGNFTFMWMRGDGKMLPENPQNGTIGNCGTFNAL